MNHHQYHSTQLRSSFSSQKVLPFGPKYTGEGKLDFYAQNQKDKNFEEQKEEAPLYEIDINSRKPTTASTRVNDLSSYNKNPHPKKQGMMEKPSQPQYQRTILGQADMNSQQMYPAKTGYGGKKEYDSSFNDPSAAPGGYIPQDNIDPQSQMFDKFGAEPGAKYKKGPAKPQMPVNTHPHSMAHKSKNMHTKINRGISPNQPPASMKNKTRTGKNYNNKIGKYPVKESTEGSRRSSSLKTKEKDKMQYNKPSPSSRTNQRGGSFVAPPNATGKSERTRKTKTGSAGSSKHGYAKSNNSMGGSNSNSQYGFGSSYGHRNPGNSNFTANPRIRKSNNNGPTAHNKMASFRSGPVKAVGESAASRDNNTSDSRKGQIGESRKGGHAQDSRKGYSDNSRKTQSKESNKRPSSASKATKTSSKMVSKVSNRPGTASTRTSSNRPPSPGTRSLKSDLLFSSYKYK